MRSSWVFGMGGEDEETGKRQEGKGEGKGLYNLSSAMYSSELLYKNRKASTLVLDRGKAAEREITIYSFHLCAVNEGRRGC